MTPLEEIQMLARFYPDDPHIIPKLLLADELGLPRLISASQMWATSSGIGLSAALCRVLALRASDCEWFGPVAMRPDLAVYGTVRGGGRYEAAWDMGRARAAGLVRGDFWRRHPGAMLAARASTELARRVYPDMLVLSDRPEVEEYGVAIL